MKFLLLALAANYWFTTGPLGTQLSRILVMLIIVRLALHIPFAAYDMLAQRRHV